MSSIPKTPSRYRSRSDAKTPLTPSLVSAMNGVSLSSRKRDCIADISNPFITRSRPASPKRSSSSVSSQAHSGIIRKGGVESRLDVISRDYVPPQSSHKKEIKRSRSTPAPRDRDRAHSSGAGGDRFITARDEGDVANTLEMMSLNNNNASPGHTARLAAATGVPIGRRVLAYHEAPPSASSDPALSQQRELARPLYGRPGALPSSTGTTTNKSRRINTQPVKVLDAPGMVDDFYLNLTSWSSQNAVAVALGECTYIWRADTGNVTLLGEAPEGTYVSSVDYSNDGAYLGIGLGSGEVELWDIEAGQKLRTMAGHQGQIAVLSWNNHVLSSGCGDGSIWHHDVRVPRHKVMELLGHSGEVCGLRWRADGEMLASGGNDNVVNIWDGRVGDVGEGARGTAKWTKRNHTAAVKAIAWCPWQTNLLASGGGTNDATIHIWNSGTGARLHSIKTPAQVTGIHWSPHRKEFLSTHGYPTNAIMVHAYPSMERVAEIRDAHDSRVLYSAISPAGDLACTGAGDENLKFWQIWDTASTKKKKSENKDRPASSTTKSGILSIR
ncbi:WD40 repeat-like protein [Coniophora puteana RWD-64-598 SS2]|uniref:WD40 repeat-like protein n=1 Tax=Coniophora puteana (strain RWD-64-598) TaxID=741705 RepID=A0A5M3MNC5_CONPW|nr:WD40 repeat-like protein [Coniophora puteana RWD-64-598 SS2]EIW80121.1 WD40 repeat-like protein [Coniophora puteana RWD-64-598 SS2]